MITAAHWPFQHFAGAQIRIQAGHDVLVRHTDGTESSAMFPRLIAPQQVLRNIRGLQHAVSTGWDMSVDFEGETSWETEDQRQWCDFSFKTYVRPLSSQTPYTLAAGTVTIQRVVVKVRCSCSPTVTRCSPFHPYAPRLRRPRPLPSVRRGTHFSTP